MKHLRVTVHVDDDYTPEFFELLADSPAIAEARLVDWSMTASEQSTLLYIVDGDPTPFAEQAANTAGIDSVELSDTKQGRTYVLVVMRPLETPMFAAIHRASTQAGLIVRKPIIYRDGTMSARVVGDAGALQRALEAAPDGVEVQIDTISQFYGHTDDPVVGLSDRQREAVAVALELGYYNQPRGATHEDVAAELECAPQTASDHLQKAEANIIRAVMDEFGGDA
ncbi:helix-turn-helix domain-containing protein [Halorientalis marina]|uniref:helix-turn-helix domain-containing protein n=1 Tax=Halorientalis marina TaxID=2931976 RepID=UPI001FF6BD02|nr:helix-turn-helix domain-containing protein [Halorientalis marina]